jgi:hypothetical protein
MSPPQLPSSSFVTFQNGWWRAWLRIRLDLASPMVFPLFLAGKMHKEQSISFIHMPSLSLLMCRLDMFFSYLFTYMLHLATRNFFH